jgi:hypothetical protein
LVTNDILAYPARRMRFLPSEEERRRILVRDGIAWVLVGLIHLLMFLGLVISLEQARVRPGSRSGVETIFDLSMMRARPLPLNIAPPEPNEQRDISAKPLTVIPPKPPVVQVEPPASPQATPGDVLNSVGQYLACSAGIFEYLNRQQQARCLHQPWQGLELPNGTIVLLPPSLQAAPGPLQMTGAEALQRRSQTAPDCPIMVNTPCLADMFNGGGQLAPGIPDPHQ